MGTKTLKVAGSDSGIVVSDNRVRINAGEDNGINVDKKGITFCGPISFVNGINQIRSGGIFTFNNMVTLTLPSTIATPSPVLIIDLPVKQIKSLMEETAIMMAMIAGVGAAAL
jgi:hypothetical protein